MITPGVHLQQDLHSFSCATVIYINGSHATYGSHAAKQAYWKYLGPQLPSLNNNNNNNKKPKPKKQRGRNKKVLFSHRRRSREHLWQKQRCHSLLTRHSAGQQGISIRDAGRRPAALWAYVTVNLKLEPPRGCKMTNSAAGGGAGCQQSKVSIIYHLLKDTTFCSHAEICGKRILIPPACGLAEAASALPSAGAGLGAGASQYESRPCWDPALQEWLESPRSITCLRWVNSRGREQGCEPPRRLGQGWGLRSRHHLAPQIMKSWFPQQEQRAGGTPAPTKARA